MIETNHAIVALYELAREYGIPSYEIENWQDTHVKKVISEFESDDGAVRSVVFTIIE